MIFRPGDPGNALQRSERCRRVVIATAGQRDIGKVCARGQDEGEISGSSVSGGPLPSRSLGNVTIQSSLTIPTH